MNFPQPSGIAVEAPLPLLLAGLGIGILFGIFGAGGSAFATPILAMLGVPGNLAIASPLPAMIPAAFAGARRCLKSGQLNRRIAILAVAGGLPGTLLGAISSTAFTQSHLLFASGILLLVIGARMLLPDPTSQSEKAAKRRSRTLLVLGASLTVGFLSGLLANGGGFLLVPLFVVVLGLRNSEAAGTSMVTVGILTLPTFFTHWSLGNIDWSVASVFGAGLLPGSALGSRIAPKIPSSTSRRAFGGILSVFAIWFLFTQMGSE